MNSKPSTLYLSALLCCTLNLKEQAFDIFINYLLHLSLIDYVLQCAYNSNHHIVPPSYTISTCQLKYIDKTRNIADYGTYLLTVMSKNFSDKKIINGLIVPLGLFFYIVLGLLRLGLPSHMASTYTEVNIHRPCLNLTNCP